MTVAEIVADVRARGDAALRDWAGRFGDAPPERVAVEGELDERSLRAVRALADAVEAVHAAQWPADITVTPIQGIEVERRWLPVDSVGIYVPAGLVSTLVMTAVPARVAGVPRIAVASPGPSPALLGAARELGIDEVYAVGGAQAIAALAYGTETIPPVAKIVGPGNRFVNEAKLLVCGDVAIDLPAGPSEVLVIGDEIADPAALEPAIRNAGAVFAGTTAVLGDYAAGSNHVLPTGGLARGTGGLGLEAFLRPVQFVRASRDGLAAVRETIETLAGLEGLPLHARAVEVRT